MRQRKMTPNLIGIVVGGLLGFILIKKNPTIEIESLLFQIGIFFLLALIFILISVIIHESGHLVFGLLNNYRFLSFTLFFISLIKKDGEFKFEKGGISGAAGQCLMVPNKTKMTLVETTMYNLGGVIFNLTLALFLIVVEDFFNLKGFPLIIYRLFYASNIFLGLTNLIPLKVSGIVNDGYNVLMLFKDEESLQVINDVLRINESLVNGKLYQDLPEKYFFFDQQLDYNNPLLTISFINYLKFLIETNNFEQAYQDLEIFSNKYKKVIPYYKNYLETTLIYFDLIENLNEAALREKHQKLNQIIFKTNQSLVWLRAQVAYHKIISQDQEKLIESLKIYSKLLTSVKIKADLLVEANLFSLLNIHLSSSLGDNMTNPLSK